MINVLWSYISPFEDRNIKETTESGKNAVFSKKHKK